MCKPNKDALIHSLLSGFHHKQNLFPVWLCVIVSVLLSLMSCFLWINHILWYLRVLLVHVSAEDLPLMWRQELLIQDSFMSQAWQTADAWTVASAITYSQRSSKIDFILDFGLILRANRWKQVFLLHKWWLKFERHLSSVWPCVAQRCILGSVNSLASNNWPL